MIFMVQPGKRFRLDGFYGAILINSTHIPLTIISNNREEYKTKESDDAD